MKIKFLLIIISFFLFTSNLFSQSPFLGNWKGQLNVAGKTISIEINLSHKSEFKGKLSIPEQNTFDLNLVDLKITGSNISFNILPNPHTAYFKGNLIKSDSINGKFKQYGLRGNFILKRIKDIDSENNQELNDYNFESRDVIFYNNNIKLSGTLTLPDTIGKHPAIILLSGSGAQNRDENIYGFKIFRILANQLTSGGFAVLRFDDRGIGGSSVGETEATTADYAEDALAAIQFLGTQNNINLNEIGLLGHSEGGLAAMMAASSSADVSFLILMATPSIPGGDLVLNQMKTLLNEKGIPNNLINEKLKLEKQIIAAIQNHDDLSEFRNDLFESSLNDLKYLTVEQRGKIKNDTAYARNISDIQLRSLTNPWLKFFFTFNPTKTIENLDCPVLLLFGNKDVQVPTNLNRLPFEKAFKTGGNTDYKIVVFPNANHLFQNAKSGMPDEYNKLEKIFVPGFIPSILDWLNLKVKRNN